MRIHVVTPAPPQSRKGNRITAERWAGLLRELGHDVDISLAYQDQPCDALIALHAFKSYPSIRRFHEDCPGRPLIVGLTGTDLYGDIHTHAEAHAALEMATRLVVLQPRGIDDLPASVRGKARVVYQSVATPIRHEPAGADSFLVCVMGHLRAVKDPFRTALAARLLPADSRIQVVHIGAALDDGMAEQARSLADTRYEWSGELPHEEALRLLARCWLLSLTSKLEGGANVISESVTVGVPVVASAISGSIGLLGEDYPGYFPVGDTQALARLLERAESDGAFYESLREHGARRRPFFEPERERCAWRELLEELFPRR